MRAKKKTAQRAVKTDKKKKPSPPAIKQRHPKPGLGRGLGALIGAVGSRSPAPATMPPHTPDTANTSLTYDPAAPDTPHTAAAMVDRLHTVFEVPVSEIERSPWQPRQNFDKEALRELAESIKRNGVIQPLICRKTAANRHQLIAGERRLRAAMEAGLTKVPVVLVDAEDRRAAELAIIENIQRQDLNVIEEAEGYHTLLATFNLTQQDVADRIGKARATVANALRLLDLPDEVKQLLGNGLLSTGHAKVLLGLTDTTEQILLGRKCVTDGLTVRALEKTITRRRADAAGENTRRSGKPDLPESYIRDLVDRLHRHFGTAIRLTPGITHANGKHTKGILEIDFYDNEDLDRVLHLLNINIDD